MKRLNEGIARPVLAVVAIFVFLLAASLSLAQLTTTTSNKRYSPYSPDGYVMGRNASDLISFYNATPIAQRADASQVAITDNSTGAVSDTFAAGVGAFTYSIPVQLASLTTLAADIVTDITPGYKFKLLGADFVTTTKGTGTSASMALNLEINTTNVTGGVVTVTLAGTDTLGEKTAGTAITAANTGSATDAFSVEVAASGTVFTAGQGVLLIKVQNMDTADAFASTADKWNEVRTLLTNLGLWKGSS